MTLRQKPGVLSQSQMARLAIASRSFVAGTGVASIGTAAMVAIVAIAKNFMAVVGVLRMAESVATKN